MDCQYRSDCKAIFEEGECCPNYDHCDKALTSTQTSFISENQTVDTSTTTSDMSTAFTTTFSPSTLKGNTLIDLSPIDQAKQTDNENSTPHPSLTLLEDSINSKQPVLPISVDAANFNSTNEQSTSEPSIQIVNSTESVSSTISSLISSIKQISLETDNDSNNELNKVLTDKQITANSVELNDVKLNENVTSSAKEENIGEIDDKAVSNNNLIKASSASSIALNEVTPSLNQVEIDRRNDEILMDKKLIDKKNEILETDFSTALLTTLNSIKLDEKEDEKVQSSTTVPNITDTTLLAPITSSIVNFITQSPLVNIVANDQSNKLKNELKNDKKDKEIVVEKRNEDMNELIKNDSVSDVNNKGNFIF